MKMKKILALALALLALAAAFGGCTVKKAESGGKEETEEAFRLFEINCRERRARLHLRL